MQVIRRRARPRRPDRRRGAGADPTLTLDGGRGGARGRRSHRLRRARAAARDRACSRAVRRPRGLDAAGRRVRPRGARPGVRRGRARARRAGRGRGARPPQGRLARGAPGRRFSVRRSLPAGRWAGSWPHGLPGHSGLPGPIGPATIFERQPKCLWRWKKRGPSAPGHRAPPHPASSPAPITCPVPSNPVGSGQTLTHA